MRDWQLAQAGIQMCEIEDGYLVYHPGTGRTHLLNSDAAQILALFIRDNKINETALNYNLSRIEGSGPVSNLTEGLESLKENFLIEEGD